MAQIGQTKKNALEFFDRNSSTTFQELTTYSKLIGSFLIQSLKRFVSFFRKHLYEWTYSHQEDQDCQPSIQIQQHVPQKRIGLKVNFKQFQCEDAQADAFSIKSKAVQAETRPIRSFTFHIDDFQDESSINSSSVEDWSIFLSRIGQKKIKRENSQGQKIDDISKVMQIQSQQVQQHWNKIYNQAHEDFALTALKIKQMNKKAGVRSNDSDQVTVNYKRYLQTINKDFGEDESIGEGRKRLTNLMRRKRQRVDQRFPKKITHIQNAAPQIYNVKRVLEVLQKQRQQFLKEKKRQLGQEEKIKRQAQQLEKQDKERLQKVIEQNTKKKQRTEKRDIQENALKDEQLYTIKESQPKLKEVELKIIKQDKKLNLMRLKDELLVQNKLEDNKNLFSVIQKKENAIKHSPKQLLLPPQQQIKINIQQQSSNLVCTFINNKSKEQFKQKSSTSVMVGGVQQKKKEQNPFIRKTSAKGLSLTDLINNDSKPTLFHNLITTTANVVSQTASVANIFVAQGTMHSKIQYQTQRPESSLNSPTNFMNSPIGSGFMSKPVPPGHIGLQFGYPGPMVSNASSSFHSSNLGTSYGISDFSSNFNQSQPSKAMSATTAMPFGMFINNPNLMSATAASGIGMFTNNLNSARLFQNNMFMAQSQPQSLFGQVTSQSTRQYSSQRGVGKNKKTIRIS